jgi:hypothetical protein
MLTVVINRFLYLYKKKIMMKFHTTIIFLLFSLAAFSQNYISVSVQNNYINSDVYYSPLSYAVGMGVCNDFLIAGIEYNPIKLIEKEVISGNRVDVEIFRFSAMYRRQIKGFWLAVGGYASHDLINNLDCDMGLSAVVGYQLQEEVSINTVCNHSVYGDKKGNIGLTQIGIGLTWYL